MGWLSQNRRASKIHFLFVATYNDDMAKTKFCGTQSTGATKKTKKKPTCCSTVPTMSWPGSIELQTQLSEVEQSPPHIKAARVEEILAIIQKHSRLYYKHIVLHIETWIKKTSPKYYLSGIYVIDAILKHPSYSSKYQQRFSLQLTSTLDTCLKCPAEHKDKMLRTIRLWAEKQLFEDTDVTRQLQKLVDEKKTPEKPRKVKEEVRVTPMEVVEKLKKTKESWEDEPDYDMSDQEDKLENQNSERQTHESQEPKTPETKEEKEIKEPGPDRTKKQKKKGKKNQRKKKRARSEGLDTYIPAGSTELREFLYSDRRETRDESPLPPLPRGTDRYITGESKSGDSRRDGNRDDRGERERRDRPAVERLADRYVRGETRDSDRDRERTREGDKRRDGNRDDRAERERRDRAAAERSTDRYIPGDRPGKTDDSVILKPAASVSHSFDHYAPAAPEASGERRQRSVDKWDKVGDREREEREREWERERMRRERDRDIGRDRPRDRNPSYYSPPDYSLARPAALPETRDELIQLQSTGANLGALPMVNTADLTSAFAEQLHGLLSSAAAGNIIDPALAAASLPFLVQQSLHQVSYPSYVGYREEERREDRRDERKDERRNRREGGREGRKRKAPKNVDRYSTLSSNDRNNDRNMIDRYISPEEKERDNRERERDNPGRTIVGATGDSHAFDHYVPQDNVIPTVKHSEEGEIKMEKGEGKRKIDRRRYKSLEEDPQPPAPQPTQTVQLPQPPQPPQPQHEHQKQHKQNRVITKTETGEVKFTVTFSENNRLTASENKNTNKSNSTNNNNPNANSRKRKKGSGGRNKNDYTENKKRKVYTVQ